MISVDKVTRGFVPSIEWMRVKYSEINDELFHGELGECSFQIFTTGRGSQGKTLGRFKLSGKNLTANTYSRRMSYNGIYRTIEINRNNFVEYCKPVILLNGNYSGTEYGFLSTLVHEMCHYYTYMNGLLPSKAHGTEFYSIGRRISVMSQGLFTIERLASAEEMSHFDLSDEMKDKRERRMNNRKSSLYAIFRYYNNNEIHLTTTSSMNLIRSSYNFSNSINKNVVKVIISNDESLIDFLFNKGYNKNLRTLSYWNVENKDWIVMLDNVKKEVINNPRYMNESKNIIDKLISEAIINLINEKVNGENIELSPDMELGEYSPLEI